MAAGGGIYEGKNVASLNRESQFSALVADVPDLLIDRPNLQHLIRARLVHTRGYVLTTSDRDVFYSAS